MNLTQVGYLGNAGPIFVDTTSVPGQAIIFLGTIGANGITLTAKDPQYAQNLQALGPFPYSPSQCTLGSYANNQSTFSNNINYKIPASGGSTFTNYKAVESTWFSYTINNGETTSGTNTSTTGGVGLGGILGNTGSTTTSNTGGLGLGGIFGNTGSSTPTTKGLANSGVGAALATLIAKSSGSKAAITAALTKQVPAATFQTQEEAQAAGYTLTKDASGQLIYVPTALAQAATADSNTVYWIVGATIFIVAVLLLTRDRDRDSSYRASRR